MKILNNLFISQMLLFKLFELWGQDRLNQHFKSIQDFYRTRRDIMLKGIEKHLTGNCEHFILVRKRSPTIL